MRNTWILIANASEARLFNAEKTTKDMQLVQAYSHQESREKIANLIDGGKGSYRKTPSPKSAYEEPTNPRQVEIERFAHQLAHKLNDGRNKNLYRNLVLIAPSQFQGLLNKFCNPHVKNLIVIRMDKDYTKYKKEELLHYLDGKIRIRYAA